MKMPTLYISAMSVFGHLRVLESVSKDTTGDVVKDLPLQERVDAIRGWLSERCIHLTSDVAITAVYGERQDNVTYQMPCLALYDMAVKDYWVWDAIRQDLSDSYFDIRFMDWANMVSWYSANEELKQAVRRNPKPDGDEGWTIYVY